MATRTCAAVVICLCTCVPAQSAVYEFTLQGQVTDVFDPPSDGIDLIGTPVTITYTADTQDGDPSPTRGRYDVSPARVTFPSDDYIQSISGGHLWVELDSDRVFYHVDNGFGITNSTDWFDIGFSLPDGTLGSDALPLTLYPPSPTAAGWGYNPHEFYSISGDVTSYSSALVPEPGAAVLAVFAMMFSPAAGRRRVRL